jgi:hypothetical protein
MHSEVNAAGSFKTLRTRLHGITSQKTVIFNTAYTQNNTDKIHCISDLRNRPYCVRTAWNLIPVWDGSWLLYSHRTRVLKHSNYVKNWYCKSDLKQKRQNTQRLVDTQCTDVCALMMQQKNAVIILTQQMYFLLYTSTKIKFRTLYHDIISENAKFYARYSHIWNNAT